MSAEDAPAPSAATGPTLDLRICHGNTMCVAMKRDFQIAEARKADYMITARMMTAVSTGRCVHCGRRVR